MSVLSIIRAAGWPIWPLIVASMAALALVVERFISLQPARVMPPRLLEEATQASQSGAPSPEVVNQLEQSCAYGSVLAAGLRAIGDRIDAAYVTACDVPLLVPLFVRRMFELLGDHEIAVPHDGQFFHPLAAVYRPSVLAKVDTLLASDRLRVRDLFAESDTRQVSVAELRDVDPQLATLANLNRPEDYQAALVQAGLAS